MKSKKLHEKKEFISVRELLEWAAECGSIFSMKYTGSDRHMALYRIDDLRITKPIKVGMLMDFYADVTREK